MIYRAIAEFYDLQDGQRHYEAGDTYPRPGLTVSPARLAELAGDGNRIGRPLIAAVDEPKLKRRKKVKPE